MKVTLSKSTSGNVLLVVLMVVVVVGIALASYMTLATNQNYTVARSQAWDEAIPVAESGIEEALTQLHYCYINNLTTNNWTLGADGYYHKSRTNSDGSYYAVSIVPTNPPIIYSTGYVVVPLGATSSKTTYVARRVRVNTIAPETGGIYAKSTITMNNKSYVDAFDSTSSLYSSGGLYNASLRETNGATVLTDSNLTNAISAGTIYGSVITGPSGGASGGPVGTAAYIAGGGTGIQSNPAHDLNDANVQFNDNTAPFPYSSGLAVVQGSYTYPQNGGTNYDFLLGTGNYSVPSVTLNNSMTVAITGKPTVLYVTNGMNISGGYVYIAPGAWLDLYLGGNGNFSGQGIINGNGVATNVCIYGLPSCQTMYFSGGFAFVGIINAPEAAFTYAGNSDFCGSIMANTVTVSGGAGFHCDTGIVFQGVTVASWDEF